MTVKLLSPRYEIYCWQDRRLTVMKSVIHCHSNYTCCHYASKFLVDTTENLLSWQQEIYCHGNNLCAHPKYKSCLHDSKSLVVTTVNLLSRRQEVYCHVDRPHVFTVSIHICQHDNKTYVVTTLNLLSYRQQIYCCNGSLQRLVFATALKKHTINENPNLGSC